ncbi:MAG TPA: M48 family metalloprotease [Pyrinomonadaceae bacterium]|nr:M48 family metalloprotease [Pyrinomonadaceae bacterium]
MRFFHIRFLVSFLVLFSFASLVLAQQQERDPAKENPIVEQLTKIAPKAVDDFTSATKVMDSGDLETAIIGYRKVLEKAPDFEPALRRLGSILVSTGKREEGLKLCERAVSLNRSPENLWSLVTAKLDLNNPNANPPRETWIAVYDLIKEASDKDPNEEVGLLLLAESSLKADKLDVFRQAVSRLMSSYPDNPSSHFFNAIKLADEGRFDAGIAEVKVAESLGTPEVETARLIAAITAARQEAYPLEPYYLYIYAFLGLVSIWAIGLLLLFLLGRTYSTRALKTLEESDPNDVTGGGHVSLKAAYRKLVSFGGIYYYVSLPVVILLIVVGTAGFIYGSFVVGRIPIYLILGLIFVGAWSIYSFVKVMLTRPKIEDPGRVLNEAEAPKLWELIRQVGAEVNTREVDEIRLTPGSELAVYERGSYREKMSDKADRVLILGVASMNGFSTNAFRAVLAHEYGHFSNRDTAGGDIAHRVNLDLLRTAESITESGANTFHNLAFQFLRLYHFIFRRITHGASRLQEVLADRVAISRYGAPAFKEGLTHVIRQEIVFNVVASQELDSSFKENRALKNLYELKPTGENDLIDIERAVEEAINRPTTEDDTHPSPADRFLQADRISGQSVPDLSGFVWDLFTDRTAITAELSKELDHNVRVARYGNDYDMLGH